MLTRIISALILIPLVLLVIFQSNYSIFFAFTLLFLVMASLEWSKLFGFSSWMRFIFLVFVMLITLVIYGLEMFNFSLPYEQVFQLSFVCWLFLSCLVVYYNIYQMAAVFSFIKIKLVAFMLGIIMFIPFFLSLIYLKQNNQEPLLLIILFMVWAIDSGAYFVGKAFGRHKLIPQVSPGKTIEGLLGAGLFLFAFISIIYYFEYIQLSVYQCVLYSIVILYLATFGDLLESMLKRIMDVKDSGNLIPGHGGILDRIDSLLAVLPIACLLLTS